MLDLLPVGFAKKVEFLKACLILIRLIRIVDMFV